LGLVDSVQSGPAVEVGVEGGDRLDSVTLHDGNVEGGSGGEVHRVLDDLPRAQDVGVLDFEDVVDDGEQDLESRRDGVSATHGGVAVEDFLEDLGVGDEAFAGGDLTFEQHLSVGLVGWGHRWETSGCWNR